MWAKTAVGRRDHREAHVPFKGFSIVYAERPLTDNHRSLASYGLKDGDVVILRQKENADPRPPVQFSSLPRIDFSSIAVPGTSNPQQRQLPRAQSQHSSPGEIAASPQGLDNPALLRDMLLANPHELSLLKERNPPLAEALLSGDLERFSRVLVEQQQDRARREQERIRLFSADPFDLEAQAKIEEDIRQQNIEENMTIAMEEAPESFGQVAMLYINCRVNGHPVKAFVDSGAQMTIMSQACAERCNIMRLVDRRWAGIAKGVGTQKIIGRVHLAQVQIEGDFLACSFSILEEQPMDMLLGLDMLKRHQDASFDAVLCFLLPKCSIDLKKNVLVIGTTGSQTPFLPEGELPECARLAYGTGREDIRPEEIADQELAEAIQKSAEDAEDLELHGEKQQDQEKNVILEGVMKGDELQTSAGLVSTEESLLASGHCSCSCSETLMEVDTVEQSLVAVCSSSGRQKARTKSPSPSHLTSHNPSMETETVQCNPSCESMEHSISTRDLQPPEDNVEMSAMDSKDNISSSSPLSDHGQPSVEAPEEFCSSVTVALKELHDLLVISCKPASENASEDVSCQSEMEAESQTGILDHLGRRVQSEHLTISDQYPQVSCHQATSESEKIDTTCAGTEDGACTSFRGLGDSSSIGREGVPRPRESVRKSCSVAITSAKPADQSHCTSDVEISPTFVAGEEGTHSQPSEHMQNPGTASLETSDVCPGAAPPSHGSDPPATQSLSSPSALPPFVFPAADVNRILGAGFTLQEALGALHRVGGNADLALLVLLAKNIVVPT
ncbi:regulatory solute carrier protein family 1 member 1 [Cricetulus griseus]|nr:regulatory solute carrier protein family 1 member 1 [Cricetulus griseus]